MAAASWRTAFLSLRDETLTTPTPTLPRLLEDLIFSNSNSLLSAATSLPPHELTSDCLFLLDLVAKSDCIPASLHACQLIHDVCVRIHLQINLSSWNRILHSFANVLDFLLRQPTLSLNSTAQLSRIKPVMQSLETLRCLAISYHGKNAHAENIHLVKFLLRIIALLHQDLVLAYDMSNQRSIVDLGKRLPRPTNLWDTFTLAFDMLGQAFSTSENLFPIEISQSAVEVLRKVMDVLVSKGQLVEDYFLASFYSSLLHCLHLVLADIKCPVSDHVSSFVAALRMFFCYGLTAPPHHYRSGIVRKDKQLCEMSSTLVSRKSDNAESTPYRPPHLRRKDGLKTKPSNAWDQRGPCDHDSASFDVTSSDSDLSDSDGSSKNSYNAQGSKVRVAAIVCIQDLCCADSKSFTSQWMALLPTSDVLKPRKFEATLMTCLLFDPHLKVRIASASAIATMMDGPSSIFLQVAEYKESMKYGSFMPLSNSLGLILMQLHTGILHLIHCENHGRLLTSLFKILLLLISSTPYSRMPGDLLPKVIISLHARIKEGFPLKNDQTGLLVTAIGCLTTAISTSPPQTKVRDMFLDEISTGFVVVEGKSGILSTLFQFAEELSNTPTCVEALQVLRAMAHNYPTLISACWERISALVYKLLNSAFVEVSPAQKAPARDSVGYIGDKVIAMAVKVLDECLRAISGFRGTEDILEERLSDTPFTSDGIRSKKVSSAPSYGLENPEYAQESICQAGCDQWSEAVLKHIPLVLHHDSAMVRGASVTCFAGITSSVFASLKKYEKHFITSSTITVALHDTAPSVRSAACRAIGVISCFPETSRSAEIIENFILAVEANTRDPLISVRITASWALANICDSLRYCVDDKFFEEGSNTSTQYLRMLIECALHLTEDGDKVKSNAVRALGSLSRYVKVARVNKKILDPEASSLPSDKRANTDKDGQYASDAYHLTCMRDSSWLERTVQAFLSCVTTGNVKVQWNVCYALSNLFSNETIELQHMNWSPTVFSILLLLLRDASNFKIRIQAAAALAVPASPLNYGRSFLDVVKGVEHALESLSSDKEARPENFKYKTALEKQLTSTMLHLLSLLPNCHCQALTDFLLRKAAFLEEWLRALCASLDETDNTSASSSRSISGGRQKKELISRVIQSLATSLGPEVAPKFQQLDSNML